MSRLWRLVRRDLLLWELSLVAWGLLVSYFATAHGRLDWTGHGLGRDFVNFWTAGHLVLDGQVSDIFRPPVFLAHEHQLVARTLPFHFWSYPPPALFLVAPLGLTAYYPGLALWSLAGMLALIPAAFAWSREAAVRCLVVLGPAVATNIALGQNGAFTAALLIGGLALLDRRPSLAGVLLGLLIFKPQIAILLPVMVLAGRRWRTMLAAGVTVAVVLAASVAVFGLDAWRGFFGPTLEMQTRMLSLGHGPFQWMMPSAYMAGRMLGLSAGWAMLVQAPFALFAAVVVWVVWRRNGISLALRGAVLMMATFVASPQAFNYDLIPACAAVLLLWRVDGWVSKATALLVWAMPVVLTAWALPVMSKDIADLREPVAPLILAFATIWLARLALQSLTRAASASAVGELASNT